MVALHIAYFEPKGTAILKIGRKKKRKKKENIPVLFSNGTSPKNKQNECINKTKQHTKQQLFNTIIERSATPKMRSSLRKKMCVFRLLS